ncbi:hypothetical protein [Methylobacterium sp.]|uniref:hypothetical protein n=1 Tax=Methylobacterium sp. TaxID=409 RepID=UPI00257EB87B|nr:hypothetical protein [Methylobacterium sp.]
MTALLKSAALLLATLLFGYPLAALIRHGYDTSLWLDAVPTPGRWFVLLWQSRGQSGLIAYEAMFGGTAPGFAGGGATEAWALFGSTAAVIGLLLAPRPAEPRRDPNATYGDARLANLRERRRMSAGLELGHDPDTGRPIRVAVRSNLLSIAPPRTGKTSGLVIPNLAAPEAQAWFGPAVVIDPKGQNERNAHPDTHKRTKLEQGGVTRRRGCCRVVSSSRRGDFASVGKQVISVTGRALPRTG